MLFGVRKLFGILFFASCVLALGPRIAAQAPDQPGTPQPPASAVAAQQLPIVPTPPAAPAVPIIILDPAHGGTDSGAHGENGAAEKDFTLRMAREVKAELERQGFRVILTRNDDSDPSYDDRAAMANASRDAIFVSLHMASTGTAGSVRTYYDQLSAPAIAAAQAADTAAKIAPVTPGGLVTWNDAQRPYLNASKRLAALLQILLIQKFPGSPDGAAPAAVRGLSSVAGPAVAIELSSVSAPDPGSLADSAAAPIAETIARALNALRTASANGVKQP